MHIDEERCMITQSLHRIDADSYIRGDMNRYDDTPTDLINLEFIITPFPERRDVDILARNGNGDILRGARKMDSIARTIKRVVDDFE
jgi:hypothetical protein